nr:sodium:dicarboxylate symporter family [uncultured bacterium]
MNFISRFIESLTLKGVLIGLVVFVITFAVSLAIVSFILVKIPETYFREDHPRELWADRPAPVRILGMIGKNILGVLLVALGVVLSLPGVPGQGILTILLGIMLLDFPGKRSLERKLISRPSVLTTVNRLRHRYGKPALILE